jgi:putative ABC transport system permease protein
MKAFSKKTYRSILDNKRQYAALIVLIAIGITIYLAFDMAVYNLADTVDKYYADYGLTDLYVTTFESGTAVEDIEALGYALDVEARGFHRGMVLIDNDDVKLDLISQTETLHELYIDQGTGDIEDDEILLIQSFAKARDIELGDRLTIQLNGEEHQLTVAGVVLSPEFIYVASEDSNLLPLPKDYCVAYVSGGFMMEAIGENYANEILVRLEDESQIKTVKEDIQDLDSVLFALGKEDKLSYRATEEEIKGEIAMAQSMPVLFLFIAAAVMAVLVAKRVEQERTEIGILKAMGYSNGEILFSYIKTTFLIGLVGTLIGMLLGGLMSREFTKLYTAFFSVPLLVYNFDPKYLLQAIGLSTVFCTGAGVFGAWRVLRLMPQESMRPKPPKKGKRLPFEKTGFYRRMRFINKMTLRNMVRQRGRFYLVLFGVALSFAMLVTPFAFYTLMDDMFVTQYEEVQIIDHDVKFNGFYPQQVVDDLDEDIDGYYEGYLEMPVEIEYNGEVKMIPAVGLQTGTQIYHLRNLEDEVLTIHEGEIYLSEGFANVLGIEKGSEITVRSYFDDQELTLKVTDIVSQKVGSNGYVDMTWLQAEFMEGETLYSGVYVQSDLDRKALEDRGIISGINTVADFVRMYEEFTGLIYISLGAMVVFGGIIAFVVVYVVSIMVINDRRREFASMRVMGFRKHEIFNVVLKENVFASLAGMVLGIPIAQWMVDFVSQSFSNELYSLSIQLDLSMFLYAGSLTILFVVLGQLIIRHKINRIDFLEALKQRMS